MRALLLAIAAALSPGVADAGSALRPDAADLRRIAMADMRVTHGTPPAAQIEADLRAVHERDAMHRTALAVDHGFRVAGDGDALTPMARAINEIAAMLARRPAALTFRPLVVVAIDLEQPDAPVAWRGAALRLFGARGRDADDPLDWLAWQGAGRHDFR